MHVFLLIFLYLCICVYVCSCAYVCIGCRMGAWVDPRAEPLYSTVLSYLYRYRYSSLRPQNRNPVVTIVTVFQFIYLFSYFHVRDFEILIDTTNNCRTIFVVRCSMRSMLEEIAPPVLNLPKFRHWCGFVLLRLQ